MLRKTVFALLFFQQLALAQVLPLELQIPGISIITSFAHDHGDLLHEIRYQGKAYPPHEATQAILTQVGWAERTDKLQLGEAWARQIALFGNEIVEKQHPKAEILPDGTFRFTALTIYMRGRSPGSQSALYQVDISPNAELKVTNLTPRSPDRFRLP